MKPYNINFYTEAENDLNRIVDYMLYSLYSKQVAINFTSAVKEKVKLIAIDPHLYEPHVIENIVYRFALVKKYIIVFRIDEQTHTVHIIAIGHSLQKRRNIVKHK